MMETNRIEYKRELTDDLEKEVVAFLNYREGGSIYIGIANDGTVYGINKPDEVSLKIKDRLKTNIRPSCLGLFDIVNEEKENKDVLKIIVASGMEKPYHIKKYGLSERGTYIRMGTSAEPMPQKMIEELFSKRTKNSINKINSPEEHLEFKQLRLYYGEQDKSLNDHFRRNLGLLTPEGKPNFVGYLMADNNIMSVKVAKYSSLDKSELTENDELGMSSLVHVANRVLERLRIENKTLTRKTSEARIDVKLWDEVALREAVVNAFVHSDYTLEQYPQFEIFPDRIEITSPGGLPEGLSQEEFFKGYSVPRNKEVMRIFKDVQLVEQLGSGIPRILKSYKKEAFIFTENFLRIVLPKVNVGEDQSSSNKEGGVIGGVIGSVIGSVIEELTERQVEVLNIIYKDNRITYKRIAELLNINESAVGKHIEALKAKRVLEREGSTRGNWIIHKPKS